MRKIIICNILIGTCLFLSLTSLAQALVISGPNQVKSGSTASYSTSTSCALTWSVSGATFTQGVGISVTFPNVGTTATISVSNTCHGRGSLIVSVIAPIVNNITLSPASQTVPCSTLGTTLTASTPSGGNGTYSYVWQSSPDGVNWSTISGAAASTYQPTSSNGPTNLYFHVIVSSFLYTDTSATATVTSTGPPLVGGSIPIPTQSVYADSVVLPFYCSAATGGNCDNSGPYSYQWQELLPGGINYANIPGATGLSYTPPVNLPPGTTSFQCVSTYVSYIYNGNDVPQQEISVSPSNVATVTVYPDLICGAINPSSQSIDYDSVPATLSVTGVSGGNGVYSYQWLSSNSLNGPFLSIPGAQSSTYNPGGLTATQYYAVAVGSILGASDTTAPVAVNVHPVLVAGSISPSYLSLPAGSNPQTLTALPAVGGNCNGNYEYQWQSSPDNANWSNLAGDTLLTFNPGNLTSTVYYRIQVSCGSEIKYSPSVEIMIGTVNSSLNYIKTRSVLKPGVPDTTTAGGLTNPQDVQQVTQYFDGLGRPIQTVAKQASPLLNDVVSIQIYDPFGRDGTKYLPYTASSNDGVYKVNALGDQNNFNVAQFPGEQYYYGQIQYENSPLDRELGQYAAGANWIGSNRGVTRQYLTNTNSDSVQIWNINPNPGSIPFSAGIYSPGQLYKNVTTDEQGNKIIEYTDKSNHVVLKKVQQSINPGPAHAGWLNTYYVYDDLANLRFVIQPRAVELINNGSTWAISQSIANELCFRYEYDGRKRVVIKKIPGAGEEWMIYDQWNRIVLSQDSNLRVKNQWLFTKYDTLNRICATGINTNSSYTSQASMQSYLTAQNLGRAESLTDNVNMRYSLTNTFPIETVADILTFHFYDDYNWAGWYASFINKNNAFDPYFYIPQNITYPYPQPLTQYMSARGLQTALAYFTTAGELFTATYYDYRDRTLQTVDYNFTGGFDYSTNQYDFSGKLLENFLQHQKGGFNTQTHHIKTKMNYDGGGRLKSVYKNLDYASSDQLVDSMQYNELGQLRTKYLGNNLDSLVYDYNIRGWMTGINRQYLASTSTTPTNYFGMELAYDKTTSVTGTTSFLNPVFNGNIAGTVWKSAGDGVARKYDFAYDNVNRLIGAGFHQNSNSANWDSTKIDFSVNKLSYDANGNILTMTQNGYMIGSSGPIDNLVYTYLANSNKLLQVYDSANVQNSQLGDFHYNPSTKGATDYNYDGNGNLILDNNKTITSITYNYLNLPTQINFKTKGSISYMYDPMGNKLMKTTVDNTVTPSKTTVTKYINGFVYQQDTLQFMSHEEGRARWAFHKYLNGTSAYGWEYDFYEKDHLGNTRVLLSQEKDSALYVATMEARYRNTEDQLFYNLPATSYARASVPGYPNDTTYGSPNDSVARLNPTSGQKVGPAIILKVMSGDLVDISTQYYYNNITDTSRSTLSASDILLSLATGVAGLSGGAHGSFSALNSTTGPLAPAVNSFLGNNSPQIPGKPSAYLNWMLLDNQFNYVASSSGALPVGAAGVQSNGQLQIPLAQTQIPMVKSGYLYIYVSNGTPGWDVFFDNLSVKTYSGPLVEENHYYPFGLAMAGISDKALKTNYAENKYRFNNGTELQNKEFSDGSGLELYETPLRSLDPQLGRWCQIDSKPHEMFSPYASMANNPILYSDPGGDTTWVFGTKGQYLGTINDRLKNQVHFVNNSNVKATPFDASTLTAKQAKSLAKSVRGSSIAFIGSKTASDMKSISSKSVELKKEIAFTGAVGKDREIRLTALPIDATNLSRSVDMGDQIEKAYPTVELQSNLFLFGHVHQYGASEGLKYDDGSDMAQQQGSGRPSDPEDYGPFLRNKSSSEPQPSPALLVTPWGATIYGGGDEYNSVKPGAKSYILYKSLKN